MKHRHTRSLAIRRSSFVVMLMLGSIGLVAQRPFTQTMKRLAPAVPVGLVVDGDVVLDTATALMWQRADGSTMSWEAAQNYCDTLSVGGYTDWRLPTAYELFSIHDLTRKNPALPVAFAATDAEYWWSAEQLVGDQSRVWCTNAGGGIGPHPKNEAVGGGGTKRYRVRAVRQVEPSHQLQQRLTDLGNDIVLDNATGRMWQQYCEAGSMTFDEAAKVADTLTHGGFTDWRVPNVKELQTIWDVLDRDPCVDMMYFPCVKTGQSLWSSTTLMAKMPTQAWIMQPELGVITYADKTQNLAVLLVRGGDDVVNSVLDSSTEPIITALYPNPSVGDVFLRSTAQEVVLYTTSGAIAARFTNTSHINVASLSSGIYFARILYQDGTVSSTLLVKH